MLIGYARVSKPDKDKEKEKDRASDGAQKLDLQLDALIAHGVLPENIYSEHISSRKDKRPELINCLKSLREGDTLVVYKLDRLGRSLLELLKMINELKDRGINLIALSGNYKVDTTTMAGKVFFVVTGLFAEIERDMIRERTMDGLASARSKGNIGGRKHCLTKNQVKALQSAMRDPDTNISELAREMGHAKQVLYRYVGPDGELRDRGKRVMGLK